MRSMEEDKAKQVALLLRHANGGLELVEAGLLNEEDWPAAEGLHVHTSRRLSLAHNCWRNHYQNGSRWDIICATSSINGAFRKENGHPNDERVFDETCWANLDSPNVDNYAKSKTLAEKAAWNFWSTLDRNSRFALIVLNPTFVIGPMLLECENGSATIIGRMMSFRTYLACPKVSIGVIDVGDVAKAYVEAITRKESDGERILITARSIWFKDMITLLRKEFSKIGYLITPVVVQNWAVKLYAYLGIDSHVAAAIHRLGPELQFDNTKSQKLLGMTYTDLHISLIEMMYSMIQLGMVRKTSGCEKWLSKARQQVATVASE